MERGIALAASWAVLTAAAAGQDRQMFAVVSYSDMEANKAVSVAEYMSYGPVSHWKAYSPDEAACRFYICWDTEAPHPTNSAGVSAVKAILIEWGRFTPASPCHRVLLSDPSVLKWFWDSAAGPGVSLIQPTAGTLGVRRSVTFPNASTESLRTWLASLTEWGRQPLQNRVFGLLLSGQAMLFFRAPARPFTESSEICSPSLPQKLLVMAFEPPDGFDSLTGVGPLLPGMMHSISTAVAGHHNMLAIGAEGCAYEESPLRCTVWLLPVTGAKLSFPTPGIAEAPRWIFNLSDHTKMAEIGFTSTRIEPTLRRRLVALSVLSPKVWNATFGLVSDPELWATPH